MLHDDVSATAAAAAAATTTTMRRGGVVDRGEKSEKLTFARYMRTQRRGMHFVRVRAWIAADYIRNAPRRIIWNFWDYTRKQ